MYRCHKCNSKMVEVDFIDIKGRKHTAIVCTYCGRIFSHDKAFKMEINLIAG